MEYGKKTEIHAKWETRTVGDELWQGTLKKKRNWEIHTVGLEFMARNTQKCGKIEMHTVGPGI